MYRMIRLESLMPETLPGVALYIRHGDSFVLYKEADLAFTRSDKKRLLDNKVDILYVKADQISTYNQYVESNLAILLNDENLTPQERQLVLYEASVNYVHEIFDSPAIAIKENMDRCRKLIAGILNDVMNASGVFEALSGLIGHNTYT